MVSASTSRFPQMISKPAPCAPLAANDAPETSVPAWWRRHLPALLLGSFAAVFLAGAYAPRHRDDWLLENAIVAVALPWLVWSGRKRRFSNASYAAIFVFLVFHEIGAHYTYSAVPYEAWLRAAVGWPPAEAHALVRNHYDRLVHFLYGLLITPVLAEWLQRVATPRGAWRWLLPVAVLMAQSACYELVEWGAAALFGGELGVAYMGAQGDVWDAQKDMALAALGSVLAASALACRARRLAYARR